MPLNGIEQRPFIAVFVENIGIAVRQDGMCPWHPIYVLEHDMAVIDAKDEYPPVKSISPF